MDENLFSLFQILPDFLLVHLLEIGSRVKYTVSKSYRENCNWVQLQCVLCMLCNSHTTNLFSIYWLKSGYFKIKSEDFQACNCMLFVKLFPALAHSQMHKYLDEVAYAKLHHYTGSSVRT